MTLSHNDLVENIADVLRGVDGDYLARIYNQICSDTVVYRGDSLFERVPDGNARRESLENVGYDISADSDQPGLWVWATPSDGCECSFSSEQEAIDAAWEDAAGQVRSIRELTLEAWNSLSLSAQLQLIEDTLLDSN